MEEIIVLTTDVDREKKEKPVPYMGWLCGLNCESGLLCDLFG